VVVKKKEGGSPFHVFHDSFLVVQHKDTIQFKCTYSLAN